MSSTALVYTGLCIERADVESVLTTFGNALRRSKRMPEITVRVSDTARNVYMFRTTGVNIDSVTHTIELTGDYRRFFLDSDKRPFVSVSTNRGCLKGLYISGDDPMLAVELTVQ